MQGAPAESVTFTPVVEDVQQAMRLGSQPKLLRLLIGSALFAVLFAAFEQLGLFGRQGGWHQFSWTAAAAFVLFPIGWLFAQPLVLSRMARQHFRQQTALHGAWDLHWTGDGLVTRTPRSVSQTPWADYVRRREDSDIILLYQTDWQFVFIPKRILTDAHRATLTPLLARVALDRPVTGRLGLRG